jgi:serine/threonine protein kinase
MGNKCPTCHSANPDTLKFCGECGTQLIRSGMPPPEVTETLESPVYALTKGSLIAGKYRIIDEIGRGGMGIVYKAEDTRLDRPVAVKVLPHDKVADPERKRRFIQEAKAASALNHPNIITIYDIDQAEGIDFIAMEYVDGRTLDDLIGRKGLRLGEALKYAIQVGDALTAAHAAGIIHRDLKPGNVMLTAKGQVKVLDFGLAKLSDALPASEAAATLTLKPATEEGKIVGTVAYMSPEQAEGKKVDARSDIFSFGSLLYEMVTGKRAFQGESSASTMAAILKENPKPAGQIVEGLPREVERLINRCLRKDVSQRFQHMDDVKIALEELKEESDSGTLTGAVPAQTRRRLYPKLAALGAIAVGLAALIWLWLGRSHPRSEAPLTAVPLTSYPGEEACPSFSPDGTQVAFQWNTRDPGTKSHIYVKQIGVDPPTRLTNSPAEEISPAWSPDGRFIAFRRELSPTSFGLIIIPQRGGRERVLAEVDTSKAWATLDGPYLAWTPDSKWLSCPCPMPEGNFGLFLFSIESGEKRKLANPEGWGDTTPAFSPDGRVLVFSRVIDQAIRSDLYLLGLTEDYAPQGEPTRIRSDNPWNFGAAWTPDGKEIVFASGTYSAPGLVRMAMGKNATPRRVDCAPNNASMPAVSRQGGRLAFTVAKFDTNIWRVDLREPGRNPTPPVRFIASTQQDFEPAYSSDGGRIAFVSERSGTDEVWVVDSDGSNPLRVTTLGGPPPEGPTWSPDGSSIAFTARGNLYVVSANGGPPKRLTAGPYVALWPCWSRDGRSIYFGACGPSVPGCEIWKMPAGGGKPVGITRKEAGFVPDQPRESADGKFIYFQQGWPRPLSIWKVPVEGGEETKILDSVSPSGWWTLGKEKIYFFAKPDQKGHSDLSSYDLETGKIQKILTVERPVYFLIAVSPDERTILFPQIDEASSDLMLVEKFR